MHVPEETEQTDLFSGFSKKVLKEEAHDAMAGYGVGDIDNRVTSEDTQAAQKDEQKTLTETVRLTEPEGYRLIGNFGKAYLLIESGDTLLIIDQHAAHERLLYDRFKKETTPAAQALLTPYVMTVSHEQKNMIDENIEEFCTLGFDMAPFGALEYKISAVPSIFWNASVPELINDALYEIEHSGKSAVLKRECIIRASCRSAVKAGDKLSNEELMSLADSFLRTNVIPTCPHGRPVISVITRKQIEKSFKRII